MVFLNEREFYESYTQNVGDIETMCFDDDGTIVWKRKERAADGTWMHFNYITDTWVLLRILDEGEYEVGVPF